MQETLHVIHGLVKQYAQFYCQEDCQGIILLVYSIILTRGIDNIRSDMDMAGNTLLNEHGYASQELINLMLSGQAKSNVHDGERDLGDNFILKGIEKQTDVGFLTLFEHYEYFEVGKFMKRPKLPIWIICSESHYSILFAVNSNYVDETKF